MLLLIKRKKVIAVLVMLSALFYFLLLQHSFDKSNDWSREILAKVRRGLKIRKFTTDDLLFSSKFRANPCGKKRTPSHERNKRNCGENWAVTTTVMSSPSEAVRRFLYMEKWCLVVVGEIDRMENYYFETTIGKNIIILTKADQEKINTFISHKYDDPILFSPKNIGYLYAIAHGAKFIWDFDDDNPLKFWMENATPDPAMDIMTYIKPQQYGIVEPILKEDIFAYNPYPSLGASLWPRGFPRNIINSSNLDLKLKPVKKSSVSFGVLQSLADIQPDVIHNPKDPRRIIFKRRADAGYKLLPTPSSPVVRVPKNTVTPYNAQATLHFYDAFWALYLPSSLSPHIADIWRSYVGQSLFPLAGLAVGVLPRPLVARERKGFDRKAPSNLETATSALVEHLVRKYVRSATKENLLEKLESLWFDLYEKGFVKEDELRSLQRWIQTLLRVGYRFPGGADTKYCYEEDVFVKYGLVSHGRPIDELAADALGSKSLDVRCKSKNLTFATADMHSGLRTEQVYYLATLEQYFYLMGWKGSLKNYPEFNKWKRVSTIKKLSPVLNGYRKHSTKQQKNWPIENYNFYKDDAMVKKIDAFVCTFPASMCLLWVPFDKSIVLLAGHRYNLGRCSLEDWGSYNDQVAKWSKDPKNVIVSTNRYDVEYLRYYTGITPQLLRSEGGYFIPKVDKIVSNETIIVFSYKGFSNAIKTILKPEMKSEHIRVVYPRYQPTDLVGHKAIVFLPYAVYTIKIFELYALGVPLFFPSLKHFLRERKGIGRDRTMVSPPYCRSPKLEKATRPDVAAGLSPHVYSPNLDFKEDAEAEMYWLQFADWNEMPYAQYFDDLPHLKKLLLTTDFADLRAKIRRENDVKEFNVKKNWCRVVEKIAAAKNKKRL